MTTRKPAAVSMDPDLYKRAKERSIALGFPTFSAYVTQLMRADLVSRGELTIQEDAGPPAPPVEMAQPVRYEKPKRPRRGVN